MALPTLHPPHPITLTPIPLTPPLFSPYGTAILTPLFQDHHQIPIPPPLPKYRAHQPPAIIANQSTALKYPSISPLLNTYPSASRAQFSMFACFPRRDLTDGIFDVKILERHPFTTQTFTPLGLSASDSTTQFLVIVAPSLRGLAEGVSSPPDLGGLEAFICNGGQAVTYAAGTWHAPMVVLGEKRVDFVVTQFVSGIADEDCQEVLVGEGLGVSVKELGFGGEDGLWKSGQSKL